jgi:prepilin-type processing-associated H-X9-DG protein/prepilin-type N-terminal cleavage/methylation domain-containing protein
MRTTSCDRPLPRRARAFTFVELLVCLFILCMLSAWLVAGNGMMLRVRETAYQIKCASNLRQLGQAMLLYSNENKGIFPRTRFRPDDPPTQYTGFEANDPFADKDAAPAPNDVTAAIFLLLRTQDVTPQVMVCPSAGIRPLAFPIGKTAQAFANFESDDNLSYSIANPYPSRKAIDRGYKWNNSIEDRFVLMADMNPGTFAAADVTPATGPRDERADALTMRRANSLNHGQDGQNVLFADGHVEFARTPFCGRQRDHIYTVSASDDGSKTTGPDIADSPVWAGDSVLLPTAAAAPRMPNPQEQARVDLAEIRRQLPALKARLAARQAWVEDMEKTIAEADAKK